MPDGYTDGYFWSFNYAIYPLGLPVIDPILSYNDPVTAVLSQYFIAVLGNYLNASFAEEIQRAGLLGNTDYLNANGYVIGTWVTNPLNPSLLTTANYKFPLVSLYREKENYEQFTLVKEGVRSYYVLSYVLPPLTAPQYNRLYSFLSVISKTILRFGFRGNDPLYLSGAPVFVSAGMTFEIWTGATYEPIVAMEPKTGQSLFFPKIDIRFNVFEREKAVNSNFEPLTDIFVEVDLVDDGYAAQPVLNFADGYVEPNITIAGFSPATGSINGNTPIAISGTGFDSNIVFQVLVAGVPATLGRSQPNLLIVFTGPVIGSPPPPGPITVIDTSGNLYVSSGNYTYV
jgi:hypothetical protein